jgi:nucleotide-binding universal stress UspA family protein
MNELPTVVAAVRDSDNAASIYRAAKALSSPDTGGRAFAVHAVGEVSPSLREVLFPYACFGEDEDDIHAEVLRLAHGRIARHLGEAELPREAIRVVMGDARSAIPALLHSLDSDLVIVGSGERTAGLWPTLGVAGDILRRSHAPVLVLRPLVEPTLTLKRILVGVDLSAGSAHVLLAALEWAYRTGGQVQPVYVLPDASALDHAGLIEPQGAGRLKKAVNQLWTQLESQLKPRFPVAEKLESLLRPRIVTAGDPATKLVELAAAAETDLVVVGRCRDEDGSGMRLGRVAEQVVRVAHCHVMVIPNAAMDE